MMLSLDICTETIEAWKIVGIFILIKTKVTIVTNKIGDINDW